MDRRINNIPRRPDPIPSYLYPMKYVLYGLLIYLAYQFIFNFLIPVFKTSRRLRKNFREMHDRMQEQMKQQQGYTAPDPSPRKSPKPSSNDYIDFEEVGNRSF